MPFSAVSGKRELEYRILRSYSPENSRRLSEIGS